jgi:hypothetical protein
MIFFVEHVVIAGVLIDLRRILQALKAGDMSVCLDTYASFVQCAEMAYANGL